MTQKMMSQWGQCDSGDSTNVSQKLIHKKKLKLFGTGNLQQNGGFQHRKQRELKKKKFVGPEHFLEDSAWNHMSRCMQNVLL